MKALILGDLSPTDCTNPIFASKDTDALFHDTVSLFEGNDINFVNLECALTDSEISIEKFGPPLKACSEVADVLKSLGVNVCGLSNNHIFDFGKKGAIDTMKELDRCGIAYTGFGDNYEDSRKNWYFEKNGEKVAIVAVCEHEYSYALDNRMGSRPWDEFETMDDIREAKKEADRVIVIYHGGKELCGYPSPRLRKACRAMVKNGADLVVCQHSHCIGCYESFEGSHILYGQGNFHFVKPAFVTSPDIWDTCLAIKYDTKTNTVEFVPLCVCEDGMEIAKGEAKKAIMYSFEKRNADLESGEWKNGWREFCESEQNSYYITNAQSAAGLDRDGIAASAFAHYLDCEAHTDVWRELFKTANYRNEL
ncbi:MAG: CapA family protein [Ruminococcaceae bacterium]|nr:CapA family protein [Oscillospiraceae bacterium]